MNRLLIMAMCLVCYASLHSQIADPGIQYGSKTLRGIAMLVDQGLLAESRLLMKTSLASYQRGAYSDDASMLGALILRESKDYIYADAALAEFIHSRQHSPLIPLAWHERGAIQYHMGDYVGAVKQFSKAAEVAKAFSEDSLYKDYHASSLFWLGASYAKSGNPESALGVLSQLQSLYPEHRLADDALYMRAQLLDQSGKLPEAGALYGELLRLYPTRNTIVSTAIRAANSKIALREPNAAVAYMDQARSVLLRLENNDTIGSIIEKQTNADNAKQDIQYLRGEALVLAGQFTQGLEVFKEFIVEYPQSPLILHATMGAGFAALQSGDPVSAEKYYQLVIDSANTEQFSLSAGAFLYHAIAMKEQGKRDLAKKEFSALNVQTGYQYLSQSLLEYGQMAYEDKELETARKALERAIRESQDKAITVKVHLLLGSIYNDQEVFGKAAREYASAERIALSMNQKELTNKESILAEARLKQGIALNQNEQYRDAIVELSTFLGEHNIDSRRDEALFWLAESYYRTDLLKNAEEFYKQLITDFPQSKRIEESMYGVAWAQFRKRDFKESSLSFTQLVKNYPKTRFAVDALARKGDGLYVLRQFKESANAYKAAMNAGPRSEEGQYAAYQYGQALYRIDDFDGAIKAFRTFARSYPNSPLSASALYSVGWTLFQLRKYSEAITELKALLVTYPSTQLAARTHYTIADAYYNMEEYENAIASYSVVKNQFPQSPLAGESVKSIQYCLEYLGKVDEATAIVDDFISSNPQSDAAKDLLMNRGLNYYNGKNFQNAISEYESFLTKNNDPERNAEALFYLGKSFASLGENPKAEKSYRDVFAKYAKSEYAPLALLEIGLLKLADQRLREADTAFESMMSEYPEHPSAAQAGFERAQIATSLGDSLRALRMYSSVADKYATTEYGDQARYRMGMYYRSRGMYDSALVHFTSLTKRVENITIAAEAQYRIGELWMKQRELSNAVTAFLAVRENFSSIEDWFSLSLLGLGDCYEQLKNIEAAKEVYQTLSTLRAGDDYGKSAAAKLKRLGRGQ